MRSLKFNLIRTEHFRNYAISGVLPREEAIEKIKSSIRSTYGNRELMVEGQTGIIIPPKNPTALAKGGKTREKHKLSNRFIVVQRNGRIMKKK